MNKLYFHDNLEILREMDNESVESIFAIFTKTYEIHWL